MFIKIKKESSKQNYYNTLLSNKGFSMFDGWEDNYSDLDIPKTWKNSSWTGDEYPSFAYKGWQIWISEKEDERARFNIGELRNYSSSTVWFWTDDFNKALNFVNSKTAPFIGVK